MRTLKSKIKYAICCITLALLFTLTGCGAMVDVYEESTDEGLEFKIDVSLNLSLDSKLNAAAETNGITGDRWTVGSWLNAYMSELSQLYGFTYMYTGVMTNSETKYRVYRFTDIKLRSANEYLTDALNLKSDYSIKTNLFFRTIKVESDDRFNYFISEFDDAYSRIDAGPSEADKETVAGIFLFGLRNVYPAYEGQPNHPDIADDPSYRYDESTGEVYRVVLPAFTEAFNADISDYKNLDLRNFWHVAAKIKAESDAVAYVDEDGQRKVYYVFAKKAGDGDTEIRYSYLRADPTGWYIVAVICGGIAVAITVTVAKKRKKQKAEPPPKPQDNYPYDPFDGNIDPFA